MAIFQAQALLAPFCSPRFERYGCKYLEIINYLKSSATMVFKEQIRVKGGKNILVANILNKIELKHICRERLEGQYANNINCVNKQEQMDKKTLSTKHRQSTRLQWSSLTPLWYHLVQKIQSTEKFVHINSVLEMMFDMRFFMLCFNHLWPL